MQHFITIIMSLFTLILGTMGFMIKRTIFRELDNLGEEMKTKVDAEVYLQNHREAKEDFKEIKFLIRENGDLLQKLAIDVAVLKAKEDK